MLGKMIRSNLSLAFLGAFAGSMSLVEDSTFGTVAGAVFFFLSGFFARDAYNAWLLTRNDE